MQKDIKELDATIARQQNGMARLNSKLADTKAWKATVEDEVFILQGKLDQAAKVRSLLLAAARQILRGLQALQEHTLALSKLLAV